MKLRKKLIVNADDYGRCSEVNSATEQLAAVKRLGGVSLLVNGECFDQAIAFLQQNKFVSPGVHLNAVEGKPTTQNSSVEIIINKQGEFLSLGALLKRWSLHPMAVTRAVEIEWRAQIEKILVAKLSLFHADSHQHLHAFPFAFRLTQRLCKEYGIKALRMPRERYSMPGRKLASLGLNGAIFCSQITQWRNTQINLNDHFLGFRRAGAYDDFSLRADLKMLPNGLTEIALHPSTVDYLPYPSMQGKQELDALLAKDLHAYCASLGIEFVNWESVGR